MIFIVLLSFFFHLLLKKIMLCWGYQVLLHVWSTPLFIWVRNCYIMVEQRASHPILVLQTKKSTKQISQFHATLIILICQDESTNEVLTKFHKKKCKKNSKRTTNARRDHYLVRARKKLGWTNSRRGLRPVRVYSEKRQWGNFSNLRIMLYL